MSGPSEDTTMTEQIEDSLIATYIGDLSSLPAVDEDVPVTNRMYLKTLAMMEGRGISIQTYLPAFLKALDPTVKLPNKISNLTRKVKKYVTTHADKQMAESEIVKGIHPPDGIYGGFTEELLLQGCLPISSPTIADILDLRSFLKVRQLPWSFFHKWVREMFGMSPQEIDASSIINQCNRLHQQKRTCSSKDFLQKPYIPLQKQKVCQQSCKADESGQCNNPSETQNLKQKVLELQASLSVNISEKQDLQHIIHQQNSKLSKLTKVACQFNKQKQKLSELRSSLQTRNVTKRINWRNRRIEELSIKNKQLLEEIVELRDSVTACEQLKKNSQKLASHYYNKYLKLQQCSTNSDLMEKITDLERENEVLREQLDLEVDKPAVDTFSGSKYDDSVRQCYIDLLSMGVSVGRCEPVIRSVIANLTNLTVGRLPSKATASLLQVEAQILSEQQALDTLLSHKNNTLHTDNTKKKGREYAGIQVSVESEPPVFLDIVEMVSGDTESVFDALKLSLGHLAGNVTQTEGEKSDLVARLMFSLRNLMTDRHIVNKKIVTSLQEWRRELLPRVITRADLTEGEKVDLVNMNSLFCGLHVVVNMASEAKKSLKQYEDKHISEEDLGPGFKTSNARSYDLVYQACKALTTGPETRSDQKSGYGVEFSIYMEGLKKEVKLVQFLGNRFNVLFRNGAATYFHREDIHEFLSGGYITDSNDKLNFLLKCILEQIQVDVNLAGCRALGLIDKLVTGPLWRYLNEENLHILDTNEVWKKLVDFLKQCSVDPTSMLKGETVFDNKFIKKDDLYADLFIEVNPNLEEHTRGVLKQMCTNMVTLCERQLADHLSGYLCDPSDALREQTKSAPLTNVISESAFADLDRCVQHAPQKSTIAKSALSCFQRNKTSSYLRKLTLQKKKRYFQIARKKAPSRRKADVDRYRDIRRRKLEHMREKRLKKEERTRRQKQLRDHLSKRITSNGGIWNSTEVMSDKLESIGGKMKRMQAVKDQITYRLQNTTVSNKKLGKFTTDGRKLSMEELCNNLSVLISEHPRVEFQGLSFQSLQLDPVVLGKRRTPPSDNQPSKKKMLPNPSPCITSGCYAAIAFDTHWYPAYVEHVDPEDGGQMTVRYLHPRGNSFIWPDPPDRSDGKPFLKVFAFAKIVCEPKNSRLWSVCNTKSVDEKYQIFKNRFMT